MKSYLIQDVSSFLKKIGIQNGDILLLHSDLLKLGVPKAADLSKVPELIFSQIQQSIGENGTLVVPTFNFDFCNGIPFNIKTTPSKEMGVLSEYIRTLPQSKRSPHPMQSFASIGKFASKICEPDTSSAFDPDGPIGTMLKLNAKILLFGADMYATSLIHFVEEQLEVPYRYWKNFTGLCIDKDAQQMKTYKRFVQDSTRNIKLHFFQIEENLKKSGLIQSEQLGSGFISSFLFKDFIEAATSLFKKNPEFILSTESHESNPAQNLYSFAKKLYPICRSITGNGVRETLKIIQNEIPLKIFEEPTGSKAFDWKIPLEWNIKDAYILDPNGNKIIDFKKNNLHVVGYSTPVDITIPLSALQKHLHSIESQPDAIPYITSYYAPTWGFCLTHRTRQKLINGNYRVVIQSQLKKGSLTYGEILIKGISNKEILLSTNICHPSLANNEISGPVVTTYLTKWLLQTQRNYSYRIIFIPETIGSLVYLQKHLSIMKKRVIAGFQITCVGDDRAFSFVPSKYSKTLSDRTALHVLSWKHPTFKKYSYLDRGSDERQYCSPGIDLPVASIMRSKYGEYPEYHTSLDNLDFISPSGLYGSLDVYKNCIDILEKNRFYKTVIKGEPQLGKRGLYPSLSNKFNSTHVRDLLHILSYCDGTNDLLDLCEIIKISFWELCPIIEILKKHRLIKEI